MGKVIENIFCSLEYFRFLLILLVIFVGNVFLSYIFILEFFSFNLVFWVEK